MTLYLVAIGLLLAGGLAAVALSRTPARALAVGTASAAAGCALGLVPAFGALGAAPQVLDAAWRVPNGAFALGLDPLSGVFAVALFAVGLAAAVFGGGYLRDRLGRRSLGAFLLFFNVLLASMALLLAARQALLFLVAWEAMSLSSFFLVAFDDRDASVRDAARVYLVASHLGTAFLFALFLLLGHDAGSLRFDAFLAVRDAPHGVPAALLLAFAVVGFGTKAGLVPLHVWLPEAHPAAPSHVSALMSAVLVKMGVYGLLRALGFLPPAPLGFGIALATIGVLGALGALALALGQRDLKRILAYSTVENVGLVALGLGVGLSGAALGEPAVAAIGVAGALLHVWNHAFMKGLAFLGAGAVVHGAGTRDVERMGGLLKLLPASGAALVLAAAALAALPPLNGFASEWLLYVSLLRGGAGPSGLALVAWLAIAALAVVGGLAAVVFTRLVGMALLGTPRSPEAAHAHEGGPLLLAPLGALAAGCLALAVFPVRAVALLAPAVAQVVRLPAADVARALGPTAEALEGPLRAALAVLVLAGVALWLLRGRLLAGRDTRPSATWGCGFTGAVPRVQYTAASYAELALRAAVPGSLRPQASAEPPRGIFPAAARFSVRADDPARARLFEPVFRAVAERASALRRFQQARLNLQLLYTLVTVLALSALLFLHRRFP